MPDKKKSGDPVIDAFSDATETAAPDPVLEAFGETPAPVSTETPQVAGLKKNIPVSDQEVPKENIVSQFVHGKIVGASMEGGISTRQDDGTIITNHPTKGKLVETPAEYRQRTVQEQTEGATTRLAQDVLQATSNNQLPPSYAQNIAAIPQAQPGQIVHDITDPHGDPSVTGGYLQHRVSQIGKDKESALNDIRVRMQMGEPLTQADLDNTARKYDDQIQQLQKDSGHIMDLQIAAREVNQNKDYDPVKLGIEKQKLLGNPRAEQDAINYISGRPLNPALKVMYQTIGLNVMDAARQNAAASGNVVATQELSRHSDNPAERIEKDNPEYFKQQMAMEIGNYLYRNENPIYGTLFSHEITQDDIDKAAKAVGLSKKEMSGIKPEDIPHSASAIAQLAQSAINTAGAPLYEGSMRALAALGIADAADVNNRFAPGWEQQSGFGTLLTGQEPSEAQELSISKPRNILGAMAKGAGIVGGFLTGSEALGGAMKAAGLVNDAEKAANIANFATATLPAYNEAYQKSMEVIGNKPEDEGKRQLYSITNGLIGGAVMMIDPKANIGRDILGETEAGRSFISTIKKGGIENLTKPELTNKYAQMLKATTDHLGLQVAMPAIQTAAENITDMVADPTGDHTISDNVEQAAVSGAVSMLLPSIAAGVMAPRNQSAMNKALMYEVGTNPNLFRAEIGKLVIDGKMTAQDADRARGIIDQVNGIISNKVPAENIEGKSLTEQQKVDYAWNLLQQDNLDQRAKAAESTGDQAQIAQVKGKIAEITAERDKILAQAGISPKIEKPAAPKTPEETPDTKKVPEKQENSQEDVSLESESERSQLKTKENEQGNEVSHEEGRQGSAEAGQAEISGPRTDIRETADGETGHGPQEDRVLKPEEKVEEATGGEPPAASSSEEERLSEWHEALKKSNLYEAPAEPQKEYSPFEAIDLGDHEGQEKTPERDREIKNTPVDEPFGETGETFIDAVNRTKKDWEELKKTADKNTVLVAHSGLLKLIHAVENKGVAWDDYEALKKAYSSEHEDPEGKPIKFKADNGEDFTVVRHGESSDNAQGKLRRKDSDLTEKGREQARGIAKKLQEMGIENPKLISSDLNRAIETRRIIEEELSKPLKTEDHATKESSKQQQEGDQQGGIAEHPGTGTPREQAPGKAADNRNSGKRSPAEEKKINQMVLDMRGHYAKLSSRGRTNRVKILRRRMDTLHDEIRTLKEGSKKWKEKTIEYTAIRKFIQDHTPQRKSRNTFDPARHQRNLNFIDWASTKVDLHDFETHVMKFLLGGYFEKTPGFIKHLPTRANTEESRNAERYLLDKGKRDKNGFRPANADQFASEYGEGHTEAEVAQVLAEYSSRPEIAEKLVERYKEALEKEGINIEGPERKQEGHEPEYDHYVYGVDPETGDKITIPVDVKDPDLDLRIAEIYGDPHQDITGFDDENNPIYEAQQKMSEHIDNPPITDKDVDVLNDIINSNINPDGSPNIGNIILSLHKAKDGLSSEVAQLIEKLQPFEETPGDNQKYYDELESRIRQYESDQRAAGIPESPKEGEGEGGAAPDRIAPVGESVPPGESKPESVSKDAVAQIKEAAKSNPSFFQEIGYPSFEQASKISPTAKFENLPEGIDELSRQNRSQAIRDQEATPPEYEHYPVGTRAVDRFGEVIELREEPIDNLLTRDEGTQRKSTISKYVQWIKDGSEPPPVKGVENFAVHNGKIVVTDGQHRVAASKEVGENKVKVWVALTDPDNPARPIYAADEVAKRYAEAKEKGTDVEFVNKVNQAAGLVSRDPTQELRDTITLHQHEMDDIQDRIADLNEQFDNASPEDQAEIYEQLQDADKEFRKHQADKVKAEKKLKKAQLDEKKAGLAEYVRAMKVLESPKKSGAKVLDKKRSGAPLDDETIYRIGRRLYNASLEVVARSIEAGDRLREAIQKGLNYLNLNAINENKELLPHEEDRFKDALGWNEDMPENVTADQIRNNKQFREELPKELKEVADNAVDAVKKNLRDLKSIMADIKKLHTNDFTKRRIREYINHRVQEEVYRASGEIIGKRAISDAKGDYQKALNHIRQEFEQDELGARNEMERRNIAAKRAATEAYIQIEQAKEQVETGEIKPDYRHEEPPVDETKFVPKKTKRSHSLYLGAVDLMGAGEEAIQTPGAKIRQGENFVRSRRLARSKAKHIIEQVRKFMGMGEERKGSFFHRLRNEAGPEGLNQLGLWMYAKHAEERNAQNAADRQAVFDAKVHDLNQRIASTESAELKEKLQGELNDILAQKNKDYQLMPDGGSGMTNEQARDILNEADADGKTEIFQKFSDELRKNVIEPHLEMMRESGLISEEEYKKLSSHYQNYVPLRVRDEVYNGKEELRDDLEAPQMEYIREIWSGIKKAFTGRASDVKAADADKTFVETGINGRGLYRSKGASHFTFMDRNNPVLQTEHAFETMAKKAEQNKADIAFANFWRDNPNTDLVEVKSPEYNVITDKEGNLVEAREDMSKRPKDAFDFYEDGKKKYLVVKDPGLKKMFTKAKRYILVDMGNKISNYTRMISTIRAPYFIVTNVFRDSWDANLNAYMTKTEKNPYITSQYRKNLLGTFKGLAGAVADWSQGKESQWINEWKAWQDDWQKHGGQISFYNPETFLKKVTETNKQFEHYGQLTGKKAALYAFKQLEHLSTWVENSTRVQVYRAAVEGFAKKISEDEGIPMEEAMQKVDREQAALIARNATVDFERKGYYGTYINAFKPFVNAAIQGNLNITYGAFANPKRAAKVLGSLVGMGIIMAEMNQMMSNCNPPYNPDCFDQIDENQKEKKWIIPNRLFGGHGFTYIPGPFNFGWFSYFGTKTDEFLHGKISAAEYAAKSIGSMMDYFDPTGGVDQPVAQKVTGNLSPIPAIYYNQSPFGGPMHPEDAPGKYSYDSYFPSTPQAFVEGAKLIHEYTGGTSENPGLLEVHPNTLQYFYNQATGGLGKFTQDAIISAKKMATGEPLKTNETPFVNIFEHTSNLRPLKEEYFGLLDKFNKGTVKESDMPATINRMQEINNLLLENGDISPEQAAFRMQKVQKYMQADIKEKVKREQEDWGQ